MESIGKKKRVCIIYFQVIKDMYNKATTSVRIQGEITKDFPIKIGLHQRLSLNSYFFTLILDVLIGHIQYDVPKYMLFAYDIVLVEKSQEVINCKLEMWKKVLESKGFHLSKNKTEYIKCKFYKM